MKAGRAAPLPTEELGKTAGGRYVTYKGALTAFTQRVQHDWNNLECTGHRNNAYIHTWAWKAGDWGTHPSVEISAENAPNNLFLYFSVFFLARRY